MSLTGLLMNLGLGLAPATWAARGAAVALLAVSWLVGNRRAGWYRWPASWPALAWPRPAVVPVGDDAATADPLPAGAGRGTVLDPERALFAATVGAALLASPIVWAHYLLLLAVPLIVLERDERTGALAFATAFSWVLVTPHLSTWPQLAVSAVIVAGLAAGPLWRAAGQVAAWRRGSAVPGAAWPGPRATVAAIAPLIVVVTALTAAGLVLCQWFDQEPHGHGAVTGAYLATLSVFALVTWGVRRGGSTVTDVVQPTSRLG
jgi:alpha-1,2-mannosyltransferase